MAARREFAACSLEIIFYRHPAAGVKPPTWQEAGGACVAGISGATSPLRASHPSWLFARRVCTLAAAAAPKKNVAWPCLHLSFSLCRSMIVSMILPWTRENKCLIATKSSPAIVTLTRSFIVFLVWWNLIVGSFVSCKKNFYLGDDISIEFVFDTFCNLFRAFLRQRRKTRQADNPIKRLSDKKWFIKIVGNFYSTIPSEIARRFFDEMGRR